MKPVLVTAPVEQPVSIAEIKAHTAIDFADDDTLLEGLLGAAVAYLDGLSGVLGRCLVNQDWQQSFVVWDAQLPLPFPDVSSAVVRYRDVDGNTQTVPSDQYEIIAGYEATYVRFLEAFTWPDVDSDRLQPIEVEFTAGYGLAADVPQQLKVAIMQISTHWYDNRDAVSGGSMNAVPLAFDALIAPHRWRRI